MEDTCLWRVDVEIVSYLCVRSDFNKVVIVNITVCIDTASDVI